MVLWYQPYVGVQIQTSPTPPAPAPIYGGGGARKPTKALGHCRLQLPCELLSAVLRLGT